MIEQEIKRLTEGLKMTDIEDRRLRDVGQPATPPAPSTDGPRPTKPTGGTVLEAIEKLERRAQSISSAARELENQLTGTTSATDDSEEPFEGGIWDRLAWKIVRIERVFAQIDEAHNHALASLK